MCVLNFEAPKAMNQHFLGDELCHLIGRMAQCGHFRIVLEYPVPACGSDIIQPSIYRDSGQQHCGILTQTRMHHEHDFPQGIGAFQPETRLTALMPRGEILLMTNTLWN